MGGGDTKKCQTLECPEGETEFVCTEPTCKEASGNFGAGVNAGLKVDGCQYVPALCRIFDWEASLEGHIGVGVAGQGTKKDGFTAGSCSCCANGQSLLEVTAGPEIGAVAEGNVTANLWIIQATLGVRLKGCLAGQIGAGNRCDGSVVPAGSLSGYFEACAEASLGSAFSVSGDTLKICIDFGFFTICKTFPRCLLKVGDPTSCPAGL